MTPLLRVKDIHKRFSPQGAPVLDGVSFDAEEGELFALVGPSGCGKTTALRCVAGFERVDAGTIELRGKALAAPRVHAPPEQRGIGFVFQDYALFPHLTVLDNVRFGLQGMRKGAATDRAREVLAMVGLKGVEDRFPSQLSGGQQQRVALARSIAPSPRLLLLDEPFSNLDAALRNNTRAEIRALLKDAGMTAILVTHDQEEALSIADRLAVMSHGRIEQSGAPEAIYNHPSNPFVAEFLGATNLIRVNAVEDGAESILGPLRLDRAARGDVVVSMRPEQLAMETPQDGEAAGEILSREFKGHDQTYRVRIAGVTIVVQTHASSPWRVGDRVALRPLQPAVVVTPACVELSNA